MRIGPGGNKAGIFRGSVTLNTNNQRKRAKPLCSLLAVCLRLVPVQRQHLQGPDVRLSPPRGRTRVSKAAGHFPTYIDARFIRLTVSSDKALWLWTSECGGVRQADRVERQPITRLEMLLLAQEKSPCSSPAPSPAEHSFRGQRSPLSPRFPLVGRTDARGF